MLRPRAVAYARGRAHHPPEMSRRAGQALLHSLISVACVVNEASMFSNVDPRLLADQNEYEELAITRQAMLGHADSLRDEQARMQIYIAEIDKRIVELEKHIAELERGRQEIERRHWPSPATKL